jgi:hypothetical protein
MFVAATFRIAPMSFTMLAAVFGCVTIIHTMSAKKRNPTILLTAYHRSTPAGGTLDTSFVQLRPDRRYPASGCGAKQDGCYRRMRAVFLVAARHATGTPSGANG